MRVGRRKRLPHQNIQNTPTLPEFGGFGGAGVFACPLRLAAFLPMSQSVKVAFASGPDDLNPRLVARMQALYPELRLYVVSEFPPAAGIWIPYHPRRTLGENLAKCRAALAGKRIRLGGVLLVPQMPYRRMRLMALLLSPVAFLAFNEHLDSFMLRPRCLGTIARHLWWRSKNFLGWQRRRDWGMWWTYSLALD